MNRTTRIATIKVEACSLALALGMATGVACLADLSGAWFPFGAGLRGDLGTVGLPACELSQPVPVEALSGTRGCDGANLVVEFPDGFTLQVPESGSLLSQGGPGASHRTVVQVGPDGVVAHEVTEGHAFYWGTTEGVERFVYAFGTTG